MMLPQAGPKGRGIVAVLAVLLGVYLGAYHVFRGHTGRGLVEHEQGLAMGTILVIAGAVLWRSRRTG